MSRPIKVEDQVYDLLDELRRKGETFSQVIEGLLGAREKVLELFASIEGDLRYTDWKDRQLREFTRAVADRES